MPISASDHSRIFTVIRERAEGQWETTVWEPTNSKNSTLIYMFDRNNSGAPTLPADQRLLYARYAAPPGAGVSKQ